MSLCGYVHTLVQAFMEVKKGIFYPWRQRYRLLWAVLQGLWKLGLGPWQGQDSLLIMEPSLQSYFILVYFIIVCVYVSYTQHGACIEAKDNFVALVLPFHLYKGSEDRTQVARLTLQSAFSHWSISLIPYLFPCWGPVLQCSSGWTRTDDSIALASQVLGLLYVF